MSDIAPTKTFVLNCGHTLCGGGLLQTLLSQNPAFNQSSQNDAEDFLAGEDFESGEPQNPVITNGAMVLLARVSTRFLLQNTEVRSFDNFRAIICVRDLIDLLSLKMPNNLSDEDLMKVMMAQAHKNGIGDELANLQAAADGGMLEGAFIMRFEDLCSKPEETITKLYSHLGLPLFQHDITSLAEAAERMQQSRNEQRPLVEKFAGEIMEDNKWYWERFFS